MAEAEAAAAADAAKQWLQHAPDASKAGASSHHPAAARATEHIIDTDKELQRERIQREHQTNSNLGAAAAAAAAAGGGTDNGGGRRRRLLLTASAAATNASGSNSSSGGSGEYDSSSSRQRRRRLLGSDEKAPTTGGATAEAEAERGVEAEMLEGPESGYGRRPTIVAVHLPLFTQWCGGADTPASCAEIVRIGALCLEQWVPLFDELGVDLVLSHRGVGYQRGRLAGSRVTYVVAGGGVNHGGGGGGDDGGASDGSSGGGGVLKAPPMPKVSLSFGQQQQQQQEEGGGGGGGGGGSGYAGGRGCANHYRHDLSSAVAMASLCSHLLLLLLVLLLLLLLLLLRLLLLLLLPPLLPLLLCCCVFSVALSWPDMSMCVWLVGCMAWHGMAHTVLMQAHGGGSMVQESSLTLLWHSNNRAATT
eukprot:COSAG06_NODE_10500_length_1670_cov_1.768300_1_plen_420_part_00